MHNIEKFRFQLNQRLRLYLWELSRGEITKSAGACKVVKRTGRRSYRAYLSLDGYASIDLERVVKWFRDAGASAVQVMTVLHDDISGKRYGFVRGNPDLGRVWIVNFKVSQWI